MFPLPTIHLVFPTPAQLGLTYEDVKIETPDDPMFGWFIPAAEARGTIFINHGAVMNRGSYFAHYQLLNELGYHVFTYDYQGFGENWGLATIHTILDDADRALAALQRRTDPGAEKIIIFGLSMGTLPSMAQAARNPDRVVGLMLEGSFYNEALPAESFIFMGILPSPVAYDRIPAELNPEANISRVTLPKLFLQSHEDTIAPFDSAKELFDISPEPKFFASLSGLHVYSILVDANYEPRMQKFLATVTAGR